MLTKADRRALSLLADEGAAVIAHLQSYWLCGDERIGHMTVRRLLDSGFLRRESVSRVVLTDPGEENAPDRDDEIEGASEDGDYRVVDDRLNVDAEEWSNWDIPDIRDAHDNPVDVVDALREED